MHHPRKFRVVRERCGILWSRGAHIVFHLSCDASALALLGCFPRCFFFVLLSAQCTVYAILLALALAETTARHVHELVGL